MSTMGRIRVLCARIREGDHWVGIASISSRYTRSRRNSIALDGTVGGQSDQSRGGGVDILNSLRLTDAVSAGIRDRPRAGNDFYLVVNTGAGGLAVIERDSGCAAVVRAGWSAGGSGAGVARTLDQFIRRKGGEAGRRIVRYGNGLSLAEGVSANVHRRPGASDHFHDVVHARARCFAVGLCDGCGAAIVGGGRRALRGNARIARTFNSRVRREIGKGRRRRVVNRDYAAGGARLIAAGICRSPGSRDGIIVMSAMGWIRVLSARVHECDSWVRIASVSSGHA